MSAVAFQSLRYRAPKYHSGIALIVVLWMLALLTIIIGSFAVLARTESLQSRFLFDTTAARYAAEAGLHRAVVELRNPDLMTRWVADGRPYQFEFAGAEVEVRMTDESGLLDINAAPQSMPEMMINLLVTQGLDLQQAEQLTDAMADWVDPDDQVRINGAEQREYESAGYPYGPANAPFTSIDELQQVIGMSWPLFKRIEDSITIHSGRSMVNPAFAPASVLAALPEMDMQSANLFIEERSQYHPSDEVPLQLPDGTPVNQRGGGLTHTIKVKATLDSGTWTEILATIRLGTDQRGRPFRIVRWIENVTD